MRFSTYRIIAVLIIAMSHCLSLFGAANSMCVPIAQGVPGTLWGQPPNWWDPSTGIPRFNTALDAPSWRGAAAVSSPLSTGATEQVVFRALHRQIASQEFLYLSWWGKAVPSVTSASNSLWVGFQNDVTNNAYVLEIPLTISSDTTPTATVATVNRRIALGGGAFGVPSGTAIPWLNGASGTGRIWVHNGTSMWAVQMRVPVNTTDTNLDNGVPIGAATFKLWFEFRAGTNDLVTFPNGYVPYAWPRTAPVMTFSDPAPFASWGTVRLTSGTPEFPDALCPTDGVSLKSQNVGTDNPDPRAINLLTPNNLIAKPHNGMATGVNLNATFRIADWNVGATPEDTVNANANWVTLATTSAPVPVAANTNGLISVPYAVSTECERCKYKVYADAHPTCTSAGCAPGTVGSKTTHQCMLVQMSGPGVDFINDSAYNNMNFANTSLYSEEAKVFTNELAESSPGSFARTVYFFIQATNMPADTRNPGNPTDDPHQPGVVGPPTTPPAVDPCAYDPNIPRDRRKEALRKLLDSGQVTYEDLQKVIPTYILHAYYDTGLKRVEGAKSYAILRPLTSLGYFPLHDGVPDGWRYGLEGAEELAPNWYRLQVGPSGIGTVRPYIEAIERTPKTAGRYRWFVDVGRNSPHGSFGDFFSGSWSANAGIERLLANNNSLEMILGYHRFDSEGEHLFKPYIWQLSVNGKHYFGAGPLQSFLNSGIGAYRFQPGGTTRAGANAGGGLLFNVNAVWGIEGVYNFHWINTSGSTTRFSTAQLGIRRSF